MMKHSWNKNDKASEYVKQWVFVKKLTTRVEDITPSTWFKQQHSQWQGELQGWKAKQNEHKGMVARKAAQRIAEAARKAAAEKKKQMEALLKQQAAESKKAEGEQNEDRNETQEDRPGEENGGEEGTKELEVEEEEEEPIDFDAIDVFGVENVFDVGGNTPLFKTSNLKTLQ